MRPYDVCCFSFVLLLLLLLTLCHSVWVAYPFGMGSVSLAYLLLCGCVSKCQFFGRFGCIMSLRVGRASAVCELRRCFWGTHTRCAPTMIPRCAIICTPKAAIPFSLILPRWIIDVWNKSYNGSLNISSATVTSDMKHWFCPNCFILCATPYWLRRKKTQMLVSNK